MTDRRPRPRRQRPPEPPGARFGVAYWLSAAAFAVALGLAASLLAVC